MAEDNTGATGAPAGASGAATERTFTQADLDRLVTARLDRERAKYADYDDLKARAATADQSKSEIAKLSEKFDAMAQRAAKAEHDSMVAAVAAEHGLTPRQARRLQGNTRDELVADAKELLEDIGKPAGDGKGAAGGAAGGDGKGAAGAAGSDGKGAADAGTAGGDGAGRAGAGKSLLGARPREDLKSGAVPATGGEEVDAAKLAEEILRS